MKKFIISLLFLFLTQPVNASIEGSYMMNLGGVVFDAHISTGSDTRVFSFYQNGALIGYSKMSCVTFLLGGAKSYICDGYLYVKDRDDYIFSDHIKITYAPPFLMAGATIPETIKFSYEGYYGDIDKKKYLFRKSTPVIPDPNLQCYIDNYGDKSACGAEVITTIYYRDYDNDGYGDPNSPFESTYRPDGYVTNSLDCNDYDSSIHPGAIEIRGDGIDQDCDGFDLPALQQDLNGIGAQVITFKFFECPDEGVPSEQRNYSNLFEQTTTRFIDFELKFEHYPPGRMVEIPLTIKYFYPDGTQMGEFIENIKIEADWTWSIHWGNGWGWVEPGGWKTGTYTVKIFEGTREIVSGEFSITTTIDQDCDDSDLSKEYTLTQTQVSQLYVSIFGRASEGEGNAYWQSTESDMTVAAGTMLNTTAARDYFGPTFDDNQAFIEFIYENTLGKTIFDDPEGITYWVSELEIGKSKAEVVTALINAAQHPTNAGEAQDRFNNKVTVSNYIADTIYSCPDVNDLSMFVYFLSDEFWSQLPKVKPLSFLKYYLPLACNSECLVYVKTKHSI